MHARILVVPLLILLAACQSEITDKPAAEVSETQAGASAATPRPEGTAVTRSVIKENSSIEFVGAKVTRDHQGKFHDFDGTIEYVDGKPAGVSFQIDLNSVETDTERLTEHLKSADFFEVARYPQATFTSRSLTELPPGSPDGATHRLSGTLDLHGVQKEVAFPVTAEVTPEGARARSDFTINRHDWGISYRGAADDLIRDDVLMKLDLLFPLPQS
jgi:polyisoprenoid-binding protein YceI